ncbi:MAG: DUF881 domain-containing protein [Clostridia bacterium]|nr:DUF881 domain-containing protein [Clostridia bacterium]
MISARSWQVSLALVFILLGMLISMQFKTQQNIINSLNAQKKEDLVAVWKSLDEKRRSLELEITDLNTKYWELMEESQAGTAALKNVTEDMNKLKIVNGLVPVTGSGITVTITGDAPLLFLDLIDLVNELWATGAEAIAINDHRVTQRTSIFEAEDALSVYITVNGEKLLYPIVVKAIGDPHTLEKGLTFTGGLVDNWNTLYSIYPEVQQKEELTIPPVKEIPSWRYAQTVQSTS